MASGWLIRHAESESNCGGATSAPAAIALTAHGLCQARQVADAFPAAPALIVTSPYARTVQTAQFLRRRFPAVPCAQWPVEEFTYLGSLHGRPTTHAERRPHVEDYWRRADPVWRDTPDSECFADLLSRAHALLDRLGRCDGLVAVFTHGAFIQSVLWLLASRSATIDASAMADFRAFASRHPVRNAAITEIVAGPAGWSASSGPRTDHLVGVPC